MFTVCEWYCVYRSYLRGINVSFENWRFAHSGKHLKISKIKIKNINYELWRGFD